MRIAYLLYWLDGPQSGVFKKVMGQLDQWKQRGHEIKLFLLSAADSHLSQALQTVAQHQALVTLTNFDIFLFRSLVERLQVIASMGQQVRRWNPDLIYCRKTTYHPALKKLASDIPLVVEINSDDVAELRSSSKVRQYANQVTRTWFFKTATGFVCVTSELASNPRFASFGKPTAVIANGIAQGEYPTLPPTSNRHPRLVFIGSQRQRWHGVDKIVGLATSLRRWHFDLVGLYPHDLPSLPTTLPNVTFHGHLEPSRYEHIMREADVAIGTLALHRTCMDEACPLKVREYLTYGLPTIIGYKDTDFPESVPFLLQLANNEDNVQKGQLAIKEFVQKWRGRRVCRDAVQHLDAGQKEMHRLAFMQSLLQPGCEFGTTP